MNAAASGSEWTNIKVGSELCTLCASSQPKHFHSPSALFCDSSPWEGREGSARAEADRPTERGRRSQICGKTIPAPLPLRTPVQPDWSGVGRRRSRRRPIASSVSALSRFVANSDQTMPTVSSVPSKIPYGGFSPVRLQTGCQQHASRAKARCDTATVPISVARVVSRSRTFVQAGRTVAMPNSCRATISRAVPPRQLRQIPASG
jgi:hypothetical protein